MKTLKKAFISLAACSFLTTSAIAEVELKLSGIFDFRAGARFQSKLNKDEKHQSAFTDKYVFDTSANFTANVKNKQDDLTYGAKIVLYTTTKTKTAPSYNGSHIYVETDDYGKVELGSPFPASNNMKLSAFSIVSAIGDGWSGYVNDNPKNVYGVNFATYDFYLSGFKAKTGPVAGTEPARAISYYTPKMSGLQLGVTFIPDTTNGGADSKDKWTSYSTRTVKYLDSAIDPATGKRAVKSYDILRGATNAFGAGVSYEHEINEDTSVKLVATGEYGKAIQKKIVKDNKDKDKLEQLTGEQKVKDLRTYNLGAMLTSGNMSYAISYGDLLGSYTSKFSDGKNKNTKYYAAAVKYDQGPLSVSLIYFGSSNRKTKLNSVTLGTAYKIAPGFETYAEIGHVQGKGTGNKEIAQGLNRTDPGFDPNYNTRVKLKASVFILGLKVKI